MAGLVPAYAVFGSADPKSSDDLWRAAPPSSPPWPMR